MKKLLSGLFASMMLLAACGEEGENAGAENTSNNNNSSSNVAAENEDNNSSNNGENNSANEENETAEADREDWPETLRFAVTGIDGMEELQRRYDLFQETMEELLDIDIEFFALSDRTVAATAMEYDQVDVILSGPSEYAQTKSAEPGAEPLAAIERDAYYTVIIVHEDSEFETIEDLKGHSVAMKEAGSTSGHIGPSALFIENGMDLDNDIDVKLLGDARVDALKNGDVDALGDGIRYYDMMVEEDGEGVWRILHEGPPLPQDPFVASPNLPDSFKEELQNVLLENDEEILGAILDHEENEKYQQADMVEIDDSDYDLMRETYSTLGIDL
ncbi:PhnD/SsuA/transferrin family substrate-binding protein [Salipaludibacillus sp. CUR1]|uniref:PhnD/SsuA/transferrin family substrate-binding protein n=1 Tax=Salipaludibacillus sp. CUR1 TaxID=2820003 RepID=UPI001E312DF8|nr:PhnD/SsuA/transferrin family substrate-binding protein [Salipaludibacillus sp. CUR1]MCE7790812.1 PhnD/SsuA/transferrin family substrate-binding protein [Salipaludibacillus sp. CUR1]